MLLARREDFEPATDAERASALYTQYQRYPFFQQRIDRLRGRYAPSNQKTAIWGCGWGYLVEMAVAAGYDAYGFDASAYAIDRGKALLPGIASRLFVRDALNSNDMTPARRDAGIAGNRRFDILVTEDVLTCLTDAERPAALTNLRGIAATDLVHVVWPRDPTTTQDPRLTWKSTAEWVSILAPPDMVYDAVTNRLWDETGEVV